MGGTGEAAGTRLQEQLSEFLYGELLHTVGAYRLASERLGALSRNLESAPVEVALAEAAGAATYCNCQLRDHLHRPAGREAGEPVTHRRPSVMEDEEKWKLPNDDLLKRIVDFYGDAEAALVMHRGDRDAARRTDAEDGYRLGACFAFVHDRQRRGRLAPPEVDALLRGRINRTRGRLEEVVKLRPGGRRPQRFQPNSTLSEARRRRLSQIVEGCADGPHGHLITILEAFNEAHIWMHEAERIRAQRFGKMFTTIPDTNSRLDQALSYCLALNTFVFTAARSTPWIFAEDAVEREEVIANYETCCDTLAPTYCMWTAAQLGLLALHRRAFTWWTMGNHERAYRDFYKLTRLLRSLKKPAEERALRVKGTKTFITGMTAMSEHHMGRIYRGQHAHKMALRYFKRAANHMVDWEDHPEIGPIVKNSHWRLNLLLNEAKANYELGRIKRSLLYYASAWRAFLLLVESETKATANLAIVEDFIKWLEPIRDDPELSRRELQVRLKPLVDQFRTLRNPVNLRLLAADIVMRMGHLLFILKLSRVRTGGRDRREVDHSLAAKCIELAVRLDPHSTLTLADLLKIEEEPEGADDLKGLGSGSREGEARPEIVELKNQWPSGSGRFEESARITEYVLHRWLVATESTGGGSDDKADIARELLASFLAHTDSSNAKLAQVYRYLMRRRRREEEPDQYRIDFVCLRRYSSFFPFLPRPSAFRAPGGGYFVEAWGPDEPEPFGIAIDPGPDFIENLYRCGYSLADIQMIVLTHDHADHIASLDALLALMANRKGLGDRQFDREEGRRLAIVGNESVRRRYGFFNRDKEPVKRENGVRTDRRDAVKVLSFEEMGRITALNGSARKAAIEDQEIVLTPRTLRLEPVQSWGHADANGYVSQAFLLRFGLRGQRSSILFTGDTGSPPNFGPDGPKDTADNRRLLACGSKSLRTAIEEADVVVAHLSAVPLRELRDLAGLDGDGGEVADMIEEYKDLWNQAVAEIERDRGNPSRKAGIREAEDLLNQIQFGFRSRPWGPARDFTVSPFSDVSRIRMQASQHLYLTGLIRVAEIMAGSDRAHPQLLLIGELREELGTFRTRIATGMQTAFFEGADSEDTQPRQRALTADIGLKVRVTHSSKSEIGPISVLCTTCDLDNDLIPSERFHLPHEVHELCVKGEDEGVFYNCSLHEPWRQEDQLWLESVERYDVFGE